MNKAKMLSATILKACRETRRVRCRCEIRGPHGYAECVGDDSWRYRCLVCGKIIT